MIVAVCWSHVITLVHIIIALPRTSGEKKKKVDIAILVADHY
jgi:hypothetical protein